MSEWNMYDTLSEGQHNNDSLLLIACYVSADCSFVG